VEKLITSAETVGRYGHRDSTLLLLAYRHGLRVSELVELQWSQVDLQTATLHVHRLRALRQTTRAVVLVEERLATAPEAAR